MLCHRHIAVEPSHQMLRSAAMLTLILRRCALFCMLPSNPTRPLGTCAMNIPCAGGQMLTVSSLCTASGVPGREMQVH